jgi:hypothetical protein
MIKKIMEKKRDTESFIVICGFDHLKPLTELLGEACGGCGVRGLSTA